MFRKNSSIVPAEIARRFSGLRNASNAVVEALEGRALFSTFTVVNTVDSGPGSLRQAITDANTTVNAGGPDRINFNIPGAGLHTISPASELPALTESVTIDGYSQPGSSVNTAARATNAVIRIELSGANAVGLSNVGLSILGGNSTVRGLVINRWSSSGIIMAPTGGNMNNVIAGNFIGTTADGTAAAANDLDGIQDDSLGGTRVGGPNLADRNLISGNTSVGVDITAEGDVVEGNLIGTDAAGTAAIGNVEQGVALNNSSNSVIRGNVISGNLQSGIRITGSDAINNQVQGNRIGTNSNGDGAVPNVVFGIDIESGANGNLIGGTAAGAGNLVSGNDGIGVGVRDADDNKIQGNSIGTDVTGNVALPNTSTGIVLQADDGSATSNTLIGGTEAGAGNLVSGNLGVGIGITNETTVGTIVQGNRVGTNAAGVLAIPNKTAIAVFFGAKDTLVGGTTAAARNIMAGNDGNGISIGDATGTIVRGNSIGVNINGAPLGNTGDGVSIDTGGSRSVIGGSVVEAGNVIAFNKGSGVSVLGFDDDDLATLNAIRLNSIHDNGKLGIDLQDDGVTANDPLDPDFERGNNLQNYPLLGSANNSAAGTTVDGVINSTPNTAFVIDFYSNAALDPSTHGEGETYLGSKTLITDAFGNASFVVTLSRVAAGRTITATATTANDAPFGDTSEFSQAINVVGPAVPPPAPQLPTLSVDDVTVTEGNSGTKTLTFTVTLSSASDKTVTVNYATKDGSAKTCDSDYSSKSGSLSFAPGTTTKTVSITIKGDTKVEADEAFTLLLSNATNAAIADGTGIGTIQNDDAAKPKIFIDDFCSNEGKSGKKSFTFRVHLDVASTKTVKVNYCTENGSAKTSDKDYESKMGTVTFAPGETEKVVTIYVVGDTKKESNETFYVKLSKQENADLGRDKATGTIKNDD